jgi:hypothetical protein
LVVYRPQRFEVAGVLSGGDVFAARERDDIAALEPEGLRGSEWWGGRREGASGVCEASEVTARQSEWQKAALRAVPAIRSVNHHMALDPSESAQSAVQQRRPTGDLPR